MYAADAIWMPFRFDMSQWEDGVRLAPAGLSMGFVVAVTEIRADLPGFTQPIGLRGSAHSIKPCPCCDITLDGASDFNGVSVESGPWSLFTNAAYVAEVQARYFEVTFTSQADITAIKRSPLTYDRNKEGYMGRVLSSGVILSNGVQLYANDRLHPCNGNHNQLNPVGGLFDVGQFELTPLPFQCGFWRFNGLPRKQYSGMRRL